MKKILHLSDLHIGFGAMEESFQQLTQDLIAQLQPASDYIIVITGDLVEKPVGTNQYQQARDLLARLESAGFMVLAAPGNHDFNNGVVLDPSFLPRFNETFCGDPHLLYPTLNVIDDIAFIGLNSLEAEFNWYDRMFADGELGKLQLQRLNALLGDSIVCSCAHRVLYLHHHPFDSIPLSALKDSRKLRRVIQKHGNVDVLLFGHNHLGRMCNGSWQVPRCYDGGSGTGKRPGRKRLRLIDFCLSPEQDQDLAGGNGGSLFS